MSDPLANRLRQLEANGVVIVDPRQTYVDPAVVLGRVRSGAVLHPGTRLLGARTFVGPGAVIGQEGPAVIDNGVIGTGAAVASGYVNDAVLLPDARVGAANHIRGGTILEEQASTAHAVGLKQSILLCFATLGSVINFCDVLIYGGRSRRDHSEIGSGFIHFNFTPWGARGDKATASLIGDVCAGVFMREPRIFMGGMAGLVGPQTVGFGALTAAGQVVRKAVPDNTLVAKPSADIERRVAPGTLDDLKRRLDQNLHYIGELFALRAWYQEVRLARIPDTADHADMRIVIAEALATLEVCIDERVQRLSAFLEERGVDMPALAIEVPACPAALSGGAPEVSHVDWVQSLPDAAVQDGSQWLRDISDSVSAAFHAAADTG